MIFRLDRFFFDEKDIFTFFFGLIVIGSLLLDYSLAPFRNTSLLVLFIFLVITRTRIDSLRFESYFLITLIGILLSLFLSPYGIAIYLFIAMVIYTKIRLL